MNGKWKRGCLSCAAAGLLVALLSVGRSPLSWAQAPAAKSPASPPPQAAPPAPNPQPNSPDANNPGQDDQMYQITKTVRIVTTPVTVFDSSGNFVYDLVQDEFKIYDNGELQTVQSFDSEMRRLSLVIVVETNDATQPFLESVHP